MDQKHQVVVRAGTSLGNILLNVLIGEGIPVERVGKNNVMVRDGQIYQPYKSHT